MQENIDDLQKSIKYEILLRKPEVLRMIGLSNSSFYQLIKDGKVPRGVPIGIRSRAWPASEINAYIEKCIAQRDGEKV